MKIGIIFLIIYYSSFSLNSFAAEKILCSITSDIDSDYGKIIYEMDSDNRTIKHLFMNSYHEGILTSHTELVAEGLKEGIILAKKDKYTIIRMHSDNYDAESGGLLYLDTLYSAVSGERKEYMMELTKDNNGLILLQNKQVFTKMKFMAKRSKVLGVIGIEKVILGNTKKIIKYSVNGSLFK